MDQNMHTRTPALRTRDMTWIAANCAARAFSACLAGGAWLLMR